MIPTTKSDLIENKSKSDIFSTMSLNWFFIKDYSKNYQIRYVM